MGAITVEPEWDFDLLNDSLHRVVNVLEGRMRYWTICDNRVN